MENAQRISQIMYPLDTDDDEDIVEAVQDLFKEVHVGDRVGSSSTPCPNPAHKGRIEDKVYVAVGNDLKECRSTLLWALQNSGGSQICILHVHQPAESIHFDHLQACQVTAYHDMDTEDMHQLLDKYKQICQDTGVCAEVQYIETEYIEKGIVEFVLQHNVRRLVMGAAADMQNSRMVELRSKKAIYVCLHATASCQIQFIRKGEVIFTRKGWLSEADEPFVTDSEESIPSSAYVSEGHQIILHTDNPTQDDGTTSKFNEDNQNATSFSLRQERSINDELYDLLVQAIEDADKSKRDAFEESIRCRKLQKDVIETKRKVSVSEKLCAKELRIRLEVEEMLERTVEELQMELEQKSSLESQIADSVDIVNELEHAVFSKDEQLKIYKKERDKLKVECDDAVRLVEELTEKNANEALNFYSEFESSEVKDAIRNFDRSLKIGEGIYYTTYKGLLRHTKVVVKVFYSRNSQVHSGYQQEVNLVSKLRHPNLVTFIGACPDNRMIIYEYLSGGSLEDRLDCKDDTPPLSWQNRIHIAAELCISLIFLLSCGVVHGNLKPTNILLDRNFVTKLSDFGIHHELSQNEILSNNYPSEYMDPVYLSTGEFTTNSDAYSFGIILLRLLTGKPALGIINEVQLAVDDDNLKNILDSSAGDWPFVQAQQLAVLALSCCDLVTTNRPNFETGIWRVVEPIRASCGLCSSKSGSERRRDIPHYFVCPIFQDTMGDPVVAADGFTYEEEAIKGWLDSGHNTSPMTNIKLANTNLVPNHALRSAIQEWLQQP